MSRVTGWCAVFKYCSLGCEKFLFKRTSFILENTGVCSQRRLCGQLHKRQLHIPHDFCVPFSRRAGFSWQPISTLPAALPLCVFQVAAWVPVPNDDSSACSAMCGASMLRTPMSPTGWWGGEHTLAAPCTCFSGSWGLVIGTFMPQDISTEASLCLKYTFKCFVLPNNYSSDALLKTR